MQLSTLIILDSDTQLKEGKLLTKSNSKITADLTSERKSNSTTMSQYIWVTEHMRKGFQHIREVETLQKEIGQLKDQLNLEKTKAQSEREWRIQACNDLLVTQQRLEEEKTLNEQLIISNKRAGGALHQLILMQRDSRTTSPMEVVTEQQAEKEENKDPQKGQKRQTPLNRIQWPEAHIHTVKKQKKEESSFDAEQGADKPLVMTHTKEDWAPRHKATKPLWSAVYAENKHQQQFLSNDEFEESCRDKRFIWKNARTYLH